MSRILLLFLFIPVAAFSYQIAFVRESRALIFADPGMKVPIGYLSKGKKIQVGDVKRNNGQVFPLVLSGKIVFIQVKDIDLKDKKPEDTVATTTTHPIEEAKEDKEQIEPIRLVTNIGIMDPGSNWDDLMSIVGGENSPMFQIEALVEVRLKESPFFFDGGFIWNQIENGAYKFYGLGFKALAQFRIIDIELLAWDINGGFNIAPGGAKIVYDGIYDKGSYYGYIAGTQIRFLPHAKWNINLGVNYNSMALSDIDDIQLSGGYFRLNLFKGIGIYIGASFPL